MDRCEIETDSLKHSNIRVICYEYIKKITTEFHFPARYEKRTNEIRRNDGREKSHRQTQVEIQ